MEPWKTGNAHVEAFGIRRLSLSIQDAASLQWEAELEECWEEYQRRPPVDFQSSREFVQIGDDLEVLLKIDEHTRRSIYDTCHQSINEYL